jgi:hypothetical protein
MDGADGRMLRVFRLDQDGSPPLRELRSVEVVSPDSSAAGIESLVTQRSATMAATPGEAVEGLDNAGAVYVFGRGEQVQSSWEQRQRLVSDSPTAGGEFGANLRFDRAIFESTLVGIGEPGSDHAGQDVGRVTLFYREGRQFGEWIRSGDLSLENVHDSTRLGRGVALDEHNAAVAGDGVVHVFEFNHSPVTVDFAETTTQRRGLDIPVYMDVVEPDGDQLEIEIVEAPEHGSAIVEHGYEIHYNPAREFVGEVSFDYRVTDERGAQAQGTINIEITADNEPPEARDDDVERERGEVVEFNPRSNDFDPDGDRLSIQLLEPVPASVELTEYDDVRIDGEASPSMQINYRVEDGYGGSDEAVIRTSVEGSEDAGFRDYYGDHGDDDVRRGSGCGSVRRSNAQGMWGPMTVALLLAVAFCRRRRY